MASCKKRFNEILYDEFFWSLKLKNLYYSIEWHISRDTPKCVLCVLCESSKERKKKNEHVFSVKNEFLVVEASATRT